MTTKADSLLSGTRIVEYACAKVDSAREGQREQLALYVFIGVT